MENAKENSLKDMINNLLKTSTPEEVKKSLENWYQSFLKQHPENPDQSALLYSTAIKLIDKIIIQLNIDKSLN